jgi:hypothetical protein
MLSYEIVDVFTDRAFSGNPLAVVLDGESLTTGQMQRLANEFHLSETASRWPASERTTGCGSSPRALSCPSPGTRRSALRTPWPG